MPAPTWAQIIEAMRQVASIYDADVAANRSDTLRIAQEVFACSTAEINLLAAAFQDNADWLANGIRTQGLKRACLNKKLFTLMRKLFVLEAPKKLMFYTDGTEIAKATGVTTKGLGWMHTPTVVRIRRNSIMNWGTSNTTYDYLDENKDPVLLIPKQSLLRTVVFFNTKKLTDYCLDVYEAGRNNVFDLHRGGSGFWVALYRLAFYVQQRRAEHECFTFTNRVPCSVYSVSAKELLDKDSKLAAVTRKKLT